MLAHETGLADTPFNIVLMGMGEPLHNYDATMKALRILADEHGLAVHPAPRDAVDRRRRARRSKRLANEPLMPNLAISLHATTDAQRDALVPINRKYDAGGADRRLQAFPAAPPRRASRSSTCCSTA